MTTYVSGNKVNTNDIKAGFKFVGGNGITYTVTDRSKITWDDAPITVTYLTLTDGIKEYTIELDDLVEKVGA